MFTDGPDGGRTLDLLPRGDVKRMLDRGFTNDNIAARQRGFEPLPHRRNGPDEIQGLFCLQTVPMAAEPSASSPEGMSSECLTGGVTNDNFAARQREFEPLPHRRNGPDENQGLFCSITKLHCQLYTFRGHTGQGRKGAAYRQDLSGQCAQGNDRGRIIALTYAKAALPLREMPHLCKLPSGCYTRPWSSIELATFMKPEILAPFT